MSLYLIAEIGINHNGDLNIAKSLIDAASAAGFNAVKFQKRDINEVYTKEFLDGPRESPWGQTQRDQKQGLEFSYEQYKDIDSYCRKLNIDWSASAWDLKSQDFLNKFNLPFNKIASAMLGHKPLLRKVAGEKIKTFISTGMASLDEIDEAVNIFRSSQCPFELMHCNSTYPMKDEDANLLCIQTLKDRYDCNVGYSGHESTLIKVCVAAVALGATSIERHITLDRAMYGSDQAASIETNSLANFVNTIRAVPKILGSGEKIISNAESEVRKKLRIEIDD